MKEVVNTVFNQNFVNILKQQISKRQFVVAQVYQNNFVVKIRKKASERVGKGITDNQDVSAIFFVSG